MDVLPLVDWLILAGLAVVIGLCVWYARRHPKAPELGHHSTVTTEAAR